MPSRNLGAVRRRRHAGTATAAAAAAHGRADAFGQMLAFDVLMKQLRRRRRGGAGSRQARGRQRPGRAADKGGCGGGRLRLAQGKEQACVGHV